MVGYLRLDILLCLLCSYGYDPFGLGKKPENFAKLVP